MTAPSSLAIDDVLAARMEPLGAWPPGVTPLAGEPQAAAL
jgi:hypothetical protein